MTFSRSRKPPDGWGAPLGVLAPDDTVLGYFTRHQELKGHCQKRDCTRRTTVELEPLIARQFHRMTRREIQQLYRCNRLDGCGLEMFGDPIQPELPLAAIADVPGIATRIKCRSCGFMRRYTVEEMIAQLQAAKKGNGSTSILKVAGLFRSPCKQCNKTGWDFDVLWPGEDTMSWRAGHRP